MTRALSIGLDFGTSNVKASLRVGSEIPFPINIGQPASNVMPSLVAYRRNKQDHAEVVAVGEDAVGLESSENLIVLSEIKRTLTCNPVYVPDESTLFKIWDNENRVYKLWSSRVEPEEPIRAILGEVMKRIRDRLSDQGIVSRAEEVNFSVVHAGCPATADLRMRRVLCNVLSQVGSGDWKLSSISEEPVLASLAYAQRDAKPDDLVLVYDFGGGTFDTAIVKIGEMTIPGAYDATVFAVDGEARCGGADIDSALMQHVLRRIGSECLGFRENEIEGFVKLVHEQDAWMLSNFQGAVRGAKERLSGSLNVELIAPPGFLGTTDLGILLTRSEVAEVFHATGLLERSLQCVLRAWRRARMNCRLGDEEPAGYHLRHNRVTGEFSHSVFKLGHDDLSNIVDRVLLVGGVTNMPFVKDELNLLWDDQKVVSHDVVDPMQAVASGAASHKGHLSGVLDRLPFSIALENGGKQVVLYEAFQPTVHYDTMRADPRVWSFRCALTKAGKLGRNATMLLLTPDNDIIQSYSLHDKNLQNSYLEIDSYGQCRVTNGVRELLEFPSPFQHPIQLGQWERRHDEERRKDEAERMRAGSMLNRSPFLENE